MKRKGKELHIILAIIAGFVGWYQYNASLINIGIILFFAFFPDIDLYFRKYLKFIMKNRMTHRSWITHSFLIPALIRIYDPVLAFYSLIGITAHLITDFIESKGLTSRGASSAEPIHPTFGDETIGWILWFSAMASYPIISYFII